MKELLNPKAKGEHCLVSFKTCKRLEQAGRQTHPTWNNSGQSDRKPDIPA